MPLKVGESSGTGTVAAAQLVGAASGILLCGEMLCPAQQLCSCSCQTRAVHTWNVPAHSFQGAAASHAPHFPLRVMVLFVQLQKQGILQAGKADGQSCGQRGCSGGTQAVQAQTVELFCLSNVKQDSNLISYIKRLRDFFCNIKRFFSSSQSWGM